MKKEIKIDNRWKIATIILTVLFVSYLAVKELYPVVIKSIKTGVIKNIIREVKGAGLGEDGNYQWRLVSKIGVDNLICNVVVE